MTTLTIVGMSAVVSGLGWFSSSRASVDGILLGCLDAGCALTKTQYFREALLLGPDFLESLVFEAFVLGIINFLE